MIIHDHQEQTSYRETQRQNTTIPEDERHARQKPQVDEHGTNSNTYSAAAACACAPSLAACSLLRVPPREPGREPSKQNKRKSENEKNHLCTNSKQQTTNNEIFTHNATTTAQITVNNNPTTSTTTRRTHPFCEAPLQRGWQA